MSKKRSSSRPAALKPTEKDPNLFTPDEKESLKVLTPVICKFFIKLTDDGKRRRIVREMIETERNYVKSLVVLQEVYFKPLDKSITSNKPLIDSATLAQLFGNIDQILDVHQNVILKNLDDALPSLSAPFPKHKTYSKIANTFIGVIPHLQQLYTSYLSSNEASEDILRKLRKSKKFSRFLNSGIFNPLSKCQEIDDLLILPTQRIAGYKLLFERVLKYFPVNTHPIENKVYQSALDHLRSVGKEMNLEKTEAKGGAELLNVAENLSKAPPFFCLMKPGRKLLGPFRSREIDSSGKKGKMYTTFVLTDILLITIKQEKSAFSSNKFYYVDAVPFSQVHFSLFPNSNYVENAVVLKTDTHEYNFYVKKKEDLDNFVTGVKKQKGLIKKKVKLMSDGGKEHMLTILQKLKSLYTEPSAQRSRKDALSSLQ